MGKSQLCTQRRLDFVFTSWEVIFKLLECPAWKEWICYLETWASVPITWLWWGVGPLAVSLTLEGLEAKVNHAVNLTYWWPTISVWLSPSKLWTWMLSWASLAGNTLCIVTHHCWEELELCTATLEEDKQKSVTWISPRLYPIYLFSWPVFNCILSFSIKEKFWDSLYLISRGEGRKKERTGREINWLTAMG
jgi:hypothetical protein